MDNRERLLAEIELRMRNPGTHSLGKRLIDFLKLETLNIQGTFTVTDIASAVLKSGYQTKTTRKQTFVASVRAALDKHPDVFERVDVNFYKRKGLERAEAQQKQKGGQYDKS